MKQVKTIIYAQSGGPTSVINSSLYGVIKQAKKKNIKLYLAKYGIQGLLNEEIFDADKLHEKDIDLLIQTPSSYLGSCRYKLKPHKEDASDYLKLKGIFEKYQIDAFLYNGGNDSMDTLNKISQFQKESGQANVNLIGIPKTIDNDLAHSDHSPGFPSAAKFVIQAFASIATDNDTYKKGRINIVEVMGRDSGFLTAATKLAKLVGHEPDLIYVPEVNFNVDKFVEDTKRIYAKKGRVNIAISEGIHTINGKLIYKQNASDNFNHAQLGGVGAYLASLFDTPTRSIELSLLQRSANFSLSKTDVKEAILVGKNALNLSLHTSDKTVCLTRLSSHPYKIKCKAFPTSEIANAIRKLPEEYIVNNNQISDSYIDYLLPLIQGETKLILKDGLIEISSKIF